MGDIFCSLPVFNHAKFLSYTPVPALGKDKKKLAAARCRTSIRDVIKMLNWRYVASRCIRDFLEVFFFKFFSNMNEVLSGEQENESIIRVRMG